MKASSFKRSVEEVRWREVQLNVVVFSTLISFLRSWTAAFPGTAAFLSGWHTQNRVQLTHAPVAEAPPN